MGLNESYNAIRGQILLINPLPSVRKAYSLITQEEKQREIGSSSTENFSLAATLHKYKRLQLFSFWNPKSVRRSFILQSLFSFWKSKSVWRSFILFWSTLLLLWSWWTQYRDMLQVIWIPIRTLVVSWKGHQCRQSWLYSTTAVWSEQTKEHQSAWTPFHPPGSRHGPFHTIAASPQKPC